MPPLYDSRLIIFTRFPRAGRVKTRFIPYMGEKEAALLHEMMTAHAMRWARALCKEKNMTLEIRYDDARPDEMKAWLGADLEYAAQGEGDLGKKMARAFEEGFAKGSKRVFLAGTDIPQLNMPLLRMVYSSLEHRDMVIVPTQDGGYCLLGLKAMIPDLFQGVAWGTDSVFRSTMDKAKEKGLDVDVFLPLRDVDTPADLDMWNKVSRSSISIIIPTLNEEDNIAETIRQLQTVPDCEIIVADGGSRDKTVSIVHDLGIKVVQSAPGRGTQMNAGADGATGDILLFLHADTLLPENFSDLVREAVSDPTVAGGAFALELKPSTPLVKFIEITINWRSKHLALPYGDQAYFVRASLFRQLGGYADIPLMEDVEFLRRLKKWGKFVLMPRPVVSSSRLFTEKGVIRTTLRNKVVFFGYFFGIPPERLHRIYYGKKRKRKNQGQPVR